MNSKPGEGTEVDWWVVTTRLATTYLAPTFAVLASNAAEASRQVQQYWLDPINALLPADRQLTITYESAAIKKEAGQILMSDSEHPIIQAAVKLARTWHDHASDLKRIEEARDALYVAVREAMLLEPR